MIANTANRNVSVQTLRSIYLIVSVFFKDGILLTTHKVMPVLRLLFCNCKFLLIFLFLKNIQQFDVVKKDASDGDMS